MSIEIKLSCPVHPRRRKYLGRECGFCTRLAEIEREARGLSRMKNITTEKNRPLVPRDFACGLVIKPYLVKSVRS